MIILRIFIIYMILFLVSCDNKKEEVNIKEDFFLEYKNEEFCSENILDISKKIHDNIFNDKNITTNNVIDFYDCSGEDDRGRIIYQKCEKEIYVMNNNEINIYIEKSSYLYNRFKITFKEYSITINTGLMNFGNKEFSIVAYNGDILYSNGNKKCKLTDHIIENSLNVICNNLEKYLITKR